jgi:hypothetical protein
MPQSKDQTILRKCDRMIERLWRHLRSRQRCHVLRVQGVRVRVRGWLMVIDGGKRTHALFPQRLVPQRVHGNNSRRRRQISTPVPFTFPPPL